MKSLFLTILFSILCLAPSALAQSNRITASVTITNATFNGLTFTVNGDTRTFTNNLVNLATQVATNADATGCGSATNLFSSIRIAPFAQIVAHAGGTNSFTLAGNSGLPMAVTASGTYASISYSTQTVSSFVAVRVPVSSELSAAERTNISSGIVAAVNMPEQINSISQSSKAASELVGTNNTQVISGIKTFSNTNGLWNGSVESPNISGFAGTVSNGNFYAANIIGGSISGLPTIYLSNNAASETSSFFTHYDNGSGDSFMIGHGGSEFFLGILITNGTSTIGSESKSYIDFNLDGESEYNISGSGSTANMAHRFYVTPAGLPSTNYFEISTTGVRSPIVTAPFIGNGGGLSNINSAGLTNTIPPAALVGVVANNFTAIGTNNFPSGSDIAFTRFPITSLANGNNAGLSVGTNELIEVSGPSASFTINGIANGRNGKLITIWNQTGFQMTIANESGTDPTAANRIRTLGSAADLVLTNSSVTLQYSAAASRWMVNAHNP